VENEEYLPLFVLVEEAKVAYCGGIYWICRYEFIRNTTFCRDDGVVVVGNDASPAGLWQIQSVAGKFR